MIGPLLFRLTIWFLLTANLSLTNIIIGLSLAVWLLPRRRSRAERLPDLVRGIVQVLVAIPKAYLEAIEMMVSPHTQEDVVMEQVSNLPSSAESLPTPGRVFLDIFLITFTPKTIVMKHHDKGWYEVHYLRRRQP